MVYSLVVRTNKGAIEYGVQAESKTGFVQSPFHNFGKQQDGFEAEASVNPNNLGPYAPPASLHDTCDGKGTHGIISRIVGLSRQGNARNGNGTMAWAGNNMRHLCIMSPNQAKKYLGGELFKGEPIHQFSSLCEAF